MPTHYHTSSEMMASDSQHAPGRESPPEDFVEQVRQALEHLYELPYLQSHPLAQREPHAAGTASGQRLRAELAAAIEALSPGASVPLRAPHARLYNLMLLHYLQKMTIQEAAHKLGISLRQAYRDLRSGEESVAVVLWSRHSESSPQEPRATQLSSVQMEMARLEIHPRPTDVRPLLERARKAVERMASQRGGSFYVEAPPEPVIISTDPVVAQQVLVNMLSNAVQQAQPGTLYLALTTGGDQASLTLRYDPEPVAANAPVINLVVAQLADRLGWTVRQEDQPWGTRTVALHMTARGPTVLVIDDNEGLVELLDRYLTNHACRVVPATSGIEGLRLAQELAPDAIILDVMMPEMDGWEILQKLHARAQTATIPVIICSVINDPELARSLGASLFLPKPVRRDDVLSALRQLGVV